MTSVPRFCRETQTYYQTNQTFQTPQDASTQMTKPGVYVSTRDDKILVPGTVYHGLKVLCTLIDLN